MIPPTLPAAIAVAAVAAVAAFGTALPDGSSSAHPFGVGQTLTDAGGTVAVYTVTVLAPTIDEVPYPVTGLLVEATVTAEARSGSITPLAGMFNARAPGGQTYRALPCADTPGALSTNRLRQGQRSTGRVYFDVTGDMPDSVVINNGMADLLQWSGPVADAVAPWPQPPDRPAMPRMRTAPETPVPA